LEALGDLPGLEELKGTGLLDSRLPTGFSVPSPSDDATLREDEEPLEPGDTLELLLAPAVEPEAKEPTAEVEAETEAATEVEATAETEAEVVSEAEAGELDTAEPDADEPDADEPDDRADDAGDHDGAEKGE
ncbi:MAG: SMC-Scp complex subunit ScpB, partial [Bradyrhizobium sp.]